MHKQIVQITFEAFNGMHLKVRVASHALGIEIARISNFCFKLL